MPDIYQLTDNLSTRQKDLEALMGRAAMQWLQEGRKNTPTTLGNYQPFVHGPGGLLSQPGVDATLFSAGVLPSSMGLNAIPVLKRPIFASDASMWGGEVAPLMTTITGVTEGDDSTDDQPDGHCDDPPLAGLLKACTRVLPYGKYSKRIRIDVEDIGIINNRGEPTDLRLANNPEPDNPFVTTGGFGLGSMVNDEIAHRLFTGLVGFARMFNQRLYIGNPANSAGNNGGWADMEGFDMLINTGFVDVTTQNVCTALDSAIAAFGADVTATDANGHWIYEVVQGIFYYLGVLANDTGLAPVGHKIFMHPDLFESLTQIWPVIQYIRTIAMMQAINAAGTPDQGGLINLTGDQVAMARDQYRDGKFLPVDGRNIPVVCDNTIVRTATGNGNQYTSTIYIVAMDVLGGSIPVTYWDYFNYGNRQVQEFQRMMGANQIMVRDGGRSLWWSNHKNTCADLSWRIKPRLFHQTPFLSARITDVRYTPIVASRNWSPDDDLFYDGGRTNWDIPSLYTDWSTSTPVDMTV